MRWRAAALLALLLTLFVAAVTGTPRPEAPAGTTVLGRAAAQGPTFPVSTDRKGWLPWDPSFDDYAGSALDMSRFLDSPAGKHGFIRVRANPPAGGPMLEFADGTLIRFWGINLVAERCFLPHNYADFLASRLASAGCNLVRLHHMDAAFANPNIFDPRFDDTRHLSASSLERLDYLIAQLEKRGIYLFVDLCVFRKPKAGDGVREWQDVQPGLKVVGQFDRRLIDLQKEYATQLMTHRNAYTGLRLIDDPAVVFQSIINESTLVWSEIDTIPSSYQTDLRERFSHWLGEQYASRAALATSWQSDPQPLAAGEDPAQGTVRLASGGEIQRQTDTPPTPRVRDSLRFLHELETGSFREMRDYLRGLGAHCLIGTNMWLASVANSAAQASLDFVDRHNIYANPKGPGFPDYRSLTYESGPAVLQETMGPASLQSRRAVFGKPFLVSEWQHAWPNEFRLEAIPLVAAHAAFQGWDGVCQFEYAYGELADVIFRYYDASGFPDQWAQWPAMAMMFHRGDLPTDPQPYVQPTGSDPVLDRTWMESHLPPGIEEQRRVRVLLGDGPVPTAASPNSPTPLERRPGLFLIKSPRTAAVVGLLQKASPIATDSFSLETPTEFGSVIVSSLTEEPILRSRRLLITAVGRAENSGTTYGPNRDRLTSPGHAPVIMDPLRGTLSIQRESTRLPHVYRLDNAGLRDGEVSARLEGGSLRIPLDENRLTLWYEVVE
jgi:hypothetical protein